MRVALGALARTGLETRVGPDLPAAINAALVYYVNKLESGRGPAKYPKFLAKEPPRNGVTTSEGGGENPEAGIEVEVPAKVEAALEREAGAQETAVTDLARHAVLVYLAELDLVEDPSGAPVRRIHA